MLRFLFSPYGRTNRARFWLFMVVYLLLSMGSHSADKFAGTFSSEMQIGLIETVVGLILLWPSIAVPIRRFHDIGMSGWWNLWFILLAVAAILLGAIVAFAVFGVDGNSFMVDESTPFKDYPRAFWAIMAAGAVPLLVELYLLGFKRGDEGENRFDRSAVSEPQPPPPWAAQRAEG